MMIRRFAVALAFLALAGSAAASTYYLRGNDPAEQSSFVTNFTSGSTSTGWSSGAAPDAAHDYYVGTKNRTLRTPADTTSTTRHTFPGKSLELKSGAKVQLATWYTKTKSSGPSVDFGTKLLITSGKVGSQSCWTGGGNNADFYGTVAIGATSSADAEFNTPLKNGTWKYHFAVTGASGTAFRITDGCGLGSYYTSGVETDVVRSSYVRRGDWDLVTVLDGDMSAYYGTTELSVFTQSQIDSATAFGGSFSLLHLSKLSVVGSQAAQTINGGITAKDGHVNVGANKSLTVGSYTSAFSPVSELNKENKSHGNSNSGKLENVYTAELWDENGQNYVPTHKMSWSSTVRVNTLTVGANGSFAATTANLGRTLLEVASGANVTFGSLTASNVYLQVKGGLVTVTDSLTLKAPFVVQSTGSSFPKPVLRVKDGAGTITESDFVFNGYQNVKGQCRYRCSVEHEDGYQVCYVEDLMPGTYDQTTGYVKLMYSESSYSDYKARMAMSVHTLEKTKTAGLSDSWSDGQAPHAGTNYYHNSNWIGSVSETFAGRSLTINSSGQSTLNRMRIYGEGLQPVVNDYRFLPGSVLPHCWANDGDFTVGGKGTLLSSHANPNFLYLNKTQATFNMDFVGDENASLVLMMSDASGTKPLIFAGDLSAYYGEMIVSNSIKVVYRTSATNATVILTHAKATLNVDSAAPETVAFGTFRYIRGAVDIAQGKTLAAGTFAIEGTMPKLGAGTFQAGGTATVGTDAVLAVSNGFIQATSADAFTGVGFYFAKATGFIVNVTNGAPLKATAAVTAADKIVVRLDGVSRTATYDEPIVIAKVPSASAASFAAQLAVKRPRGYVVSAASAGTADAEGLVPISVSLTRVGTAIFLR